MQQQQQDNSTNKKRALHEGEQQDSSSSSSSSSKKPKTHASKEDAAQRKQKREQNRRLRLRHEEEKLMDVVNQAGIDIARGWLVLFDRPELSDRKAMAAYVMQVWQQMLVKEEEILAQTEATAATVDMEKRPAVRSRGNQLVAMNRLKAMETLWKTLFNHCYRNYSAGTAMQEALEEVFLL